MRDIELQSNRMRYVNHEWIMLKHIMHDFDNYFYYFTTLTRFNNIIQFHLFLVNLQIVSAIKQEKKHYTHTNTHHNSFKIEVIAV